MGCRPPNCIVRRWRTASACWSSPIPPPRSSASPCTSTSASAPSRRAARASRTSSSTSCSRAARAWRSSPTSGTSRARAASSTAPPTRTTPTTSRCCPPPRWSGRCSWRPTGCARRRSPRQNLRNQIDVVKEEIRLNVLNRPYGGFPWILLPPVLYDTFPNAHNGYGDFSELEQASLDDAAAFFDTYYAPGNAQVTVAGYLDVDEALRLVEKHFGDIPARPTPTRPSFAEPPPGGRAPRGRARRARPAARPRRRLPAARPGRRPRRLPRPRAAGLGARRRRGRPPAAPPRARRRPGHRRLRGRGPDGAARRARPRHVHGHRGAPRGRRPRPGARTRSTRSWTSSPPKARPTRSCAARSRAGRRASTRRTTA